MSSLIFLLTDRFKPTGSPDWYVPFFMLPGDISFSLSTFLIIMGVVTLLAVFFEAFEPNFLDDNILVPFSVAIPLTAILFFF